MKKIIIASAVVLMFPAAAQAQDCITVEKGDTFSEEGSNLNVSLEKFFAENGGQYQVEMPQQEKDSGQEQQQESEAGQQESKTDESSNVPEDKALESTPEQEAAEENASKKQAEKQQNTADVENESEFEQQVIELTNQEREKAGLAPLKSYSELSDVARDKSKDMRDAGYFSHNSPNYGSPFDMMDSYNIDYRGAGENIAAGQRSPEQVVEGWMNSEGHRENIMNEDFTHIGVGHAQGGSYGDYWTQMFVTK
ncbi:CAP domain-containing protein [Salibacterium qingdaonense]|uniref:Uncharacterized protein, YkwD family n=1 Tax=Salibacterium qingdaonense TaxID=266892 RepID=A0A1I4I7P6_9BACI|nr:CAP domain-containing protein [Salibacterium qingdaonense]SFL50304.1 uncharacterized protein, YkwD family [Salibacterium qingdaonense]